jgi:hypothetical protein
MGQYRELGYDEYLATMQSRTMRHMSIDEPVLTPGLSIKECVREAAPMMGHGASVETCEIHYVYVDSDAAFEHVLINFGEKDVFLVVLIDCAARAVHGYLRLNLRNLYGID